MTGKRISILLIVAAFIATSCQHEQFQQIEGSAFGTIYHITYPGKPSPTLHQQVDSVLISINETFSVFDTTSLISRINQGQDVQLNDDFLKVLQTSLQISKQTFGAFDCTCQPLVELFGFGRMNQKQTVPQPVIDSVRTFVGYRLLSIEERQLVKKDARVQLNFNAIAKGYAVDKVADFLRSKGFKNFLVEIGGEIVTAGTKNGKAWTVGIQVPTVTADGPAESFKQFSLSDKAVATSGNYRNFFEQDGVRYTHILDPSTGKPEQTNLLSVTVIAPDCITADAYATAFMVLGIERASKIIRAHSELEGYFIYDDHGKFQVKHIQ